MNAAAKHEDAGRMPRTELVKSDWTDEERAVFLRRRRARNFLLLAALGGFSFVIYVIAMIKLHQYGRMW